MYDQPGTGYNKGLAWGNLDSVSKNLGFVLFNKNKRLWWHMSLILVLGGGDSGSLSLKPSQSTDSSRTPKCTQ